MIRMWILDQQIFCHRGTPTIQNLGTTQKPGLNKTISVTVWTHSSEDNEMKFYELEK